MRFLRLDFLFSGLDTRCTAQVVQGMIFYAFERQLVTASIEVSTIMLLEVRSASRRGAAFVGKRPGKGTI